jgi:hypothetical protein
VDRVDDTLPAAEAELMHGNLPCAMEDAHGLGRDRDPDPLADQPPRHRVGVAVDLDRAIVLHDTNEITCRPEGRNAGDRLEPIDLRAPEPLDRRLARRAVDPDVGHLARPSGQMPQTLPSSRMSARQSHSS